MGDWLGVPEWVVVAVFVVVGLSLWMGIGYWSIRRAHRRTAARRPNPTQDAFLAMMAPDCDPKIAQFLWEQCLCYVEPQLTPHPGDHLFDDLKIDDEEVTLDWPREWTEREGFHQSNLPDWPSDWPPTVRHFARWLEMGPR